MCQIIGDFSLEDGLKDDLKNISLFCRVNGANGIRPEDHGLISKITNRWGVKEYGQLLDDDDDDLSDWKYWFTALSIICGTNNKNLNISFTKSHLFRYGNASDLDNRLCYRRKRNQ